MAISNKENVVFEPLNVLENIKKQCKSKTLDLDLVLEYFDFVCDAVRKIPTNSSRLIALRHFRHQLVWSVYAEKVVPDSFNCTATAYSVGTINYSRMGSVKELKLGKLVLAAIDADEEELNNIRQQYKKEVMSIISRKCLENTRLFHTQTDLLESMPNVHERLKHREFIAFDPTVILNFVKDNMNMKKGIRVDPEFFIRNIPCFWNKDGFEELNAFSQYFESKTVYYSKSIDNLIYYVNYHKPSVMKYPFYGGWTFVNFWTISKLMPKLKFVKETVYSVGVSTTELVNYLKNVDEGNVVEVIQNLQGNSAKIENFENGEITSLSRLSSDLFANESIFNNITK